MTSPYARYSKRGHSPPPTDPRPVDRFQRAQLNSLTWPKHWRKCIYKMTRMYHIDGGIFFQIVPRNPEYDEYLRATEASGQGIDLDEVPPKPYLDAVDFDSLDEVETWARVICRLDT